MVYEQGGVQYVQAPVPVQYVSQGTIQGAPQQVQFVQGMTNEGQQIIFQDEDQDVEQQQIVVQGAPPGAPQAVILDQGAPGGPQVIQQLVTQSVAQQVAKVKHIPLAKARVLYLGSAVPMETAIGLEALQQPLRERYHTGTGEVPGIDAWLTVFSSGLQIKYVSKDSNEQPSVWFPIQTLHVCAAVKALDLILANKERQTKFVALDSENGRKSNHPPIFAAIMRRTTGRKILEAHVFVAKSNQAAMALVQSATHAYEHKEGWTEDEPDDCPPGTDQGGDPMRLLAAEPHCEKEAPPEFYKAPPKQGYYYTPNKDLVKNYNIHGSGTHKPQPGPPPMPMPMLPPPPGIGHFGGYGPPPVEYFDDWGAFNGPVSIFGPPPPELMAPPGMQQRRPKKKKKKSKKKSHECCEEDDWSDDCCCNDDRNRYDYYPDNHYREYREKRRSRRDDCRDREPPRDRRDYRVEYVDREPPRRYEREPPRERVYIERDPPTRGGRDPYYDDPYRHDRFPEGRHRYDYGEELVFYAPAYVEGDTFYDGGYGGGRGGGGGYGYRDPYGYDDLVDRFGRSLAY